jgi:periplasmic divalent cation tolerance protein
VTPRKGQRGLVQLQTTIDDRDKAIALIEDAVHRRLAACGQLLGPIVSIYWWNGSMERAEEWLCLFKTTSEQAEALKEWIIGEHSYEVPEVVTLRFEDASDAYGEWIENETI